MMFHLRHLKASPQICQKGLRHVLKWWKEIDLVGVRSPFLVGEATSNAGRQTWLLLTAVEIFTGLCEFRHLYVIFCGLLQLALHV